MRSTTTIHSGPARRGAAGREVDAQGVSIFPRSVDLAPRRPATLAGPRLAFIRS